MPRPTVVLALLQRELLVARSYRQAVAAGLILGFANLAVYFYISRTVTSPSSSELAGAPDYFAFAAPGLALGVVVQTASLDVARRIREEQLTGGLEGWLVQPVTSAELALGIVGFAYVFSSLRAALYLGLTALVLGLDVGSASPVGVAVVLALAAPAFAAAGIAVAAGMVVVRRGEGLVALLAFALTALGGAFFPVEQLPDWVQLLSALTPSLYAFDGLRAALFGGGSWADEVLGLAAFAAIALPLSLALFAASMRRLRVTGGLYRP